VSQSFFCFVTSIFPLLKTIIIEAKQQCNRTAVNFSLKVCLNSFNAKVCWKLLMFNIQFGFLKIPSRKKWFTSLFFSLSFFSLAYIFFIPCLTNSICHVCFRNCIRDALKKTPLSQKSKYLNFAIKENTNQSITTWAFSFVVGLKALSRERQQHFLW
jgi:hypothetical protein